MVIRTTQYAAAAAAAAVCLGAAPGAAFSPALPLASRAALPAMSSTSSAAMRRPAGVTAARMAASLSADTVAALGGVTNDVALSGLNGIALAGIKYPTKREVYQAIPEECFKRDTAKSLMYAAISAAITFSCFATGFLIPLKLAWAPLWLLYSAVTGTVATGMWVVAHECGHGAFSDNKALQDFVSPAAPRVPPPPPRLAVTFPSNVGTHRGTSLWRHNQACPLTTDAPPSSQVGYLYHTLLMVPYFSWQRSHAVHHAKTNHLTEGETHVPYTVDSGKKTLAKRAMMRAHPVRPAPPHRPKSLWYPPRRLASPARPLCWPLMWVKISCKLLQRGKRGVYDMLSLPATWCPHPPRTRAGKAFGTKLGNVIYGATRLFSHLVFGWPAYREIPQPCSLPPPPPVSPGLPSSRALSLPPPRQGHGGGARRRRSRDIRTSDANWGRIQ